MRYVLLTKWDKEAGDKFGDVLGGVMADSSNTQNLQQAAKRGRIYFSYSKLDRSGRIRVQ